MSLPAERWSGDDEDLVPDDSAAEGPRGAALADVEAGEQPGSDGEPPLTDPGTTALGGGLTG